MSRRRLLRVAGGTGVAGAVGLVGSAGADDSTYEGDPYSDPEYPSDEWFAREQSNWQKTREEPIRQANDPGFLKRWREQDTINETNYRQQELEETEWDRSGVCRRWTNQCTGDPYMYPAHDPVWSGDPFYEETGEVERVVFYDSQEEAARLNGRVWAPKDAEPGDDLPGVVIMCGGVATETMYWWFAQSLVENGYVAMTFDPVGQGRSEGSDATAADHHIDALDFFVSTPANPHPHNADAEERGDEDAVPIADYNPFYELVDRDRVGTAGHSMGAGSTSVVQGLDPWPGVADENPIQVAVAWDSLDPAGSEDDGYTVEPRVPVMDQRPDYRNEEVSGWIPEPKSEPPDPEERKDAFASWREHGVPVYVFTIRGTTHFEWSRVPNFPASSWESWGNEMADYFSIAWFDFWLKERGEPGYDDAESRLLGIDDDPWDDRLSFYYRSAYYFPSSSRAPNWPARDPEDPPGQWHHCEDVQNCDT